MGITTGLSVFLVILFSPVALVIIPINDLSEGADLSLQYVNPQILVLAFAAFNIQLFLDSSGRSGAMRAVGVARTTKAARAV